VQTLKEEKHFKTPSLFGQKRKEFSKIYNFDLLFLPAIGRQ
jgi:hypothetical protein